MTLKMYRWKGDTAKDSIWSKRGTVMRMETCGINGMLHHICGFEFEAGEVYPDGDMEYWEEIDPFVVFVYETRRGSGL